YEKNPLLKALVKLLPAGSSVDSLISVSLSNMKAARLKTFFDALNKGDLELSENIIATNDFLYSYFSTFNYVVRTRTDEKVKRFANILLNVAAGNITFEESDDYTSVLNELSDREFAILSLKYQYESRFLPEVGETEYRSNGEVLNPKQVTALYWDSFKEEVIEKIGVEASEFNSILVRIQRTGCYSIHKGYFDSSFEEDGNTTPLFKKLYTLVEDRL
ncbi:MAG: hypothetical protein ACXVDV_21560, partial [Bacteroidia bacterium]